MVCPRISAFLLVMFGGIRDGRIEQSPLHPIAWKMTVCSSIFKLVIFLHKFVNDFLETDRPAVLKS